MDAAQHCVELLIYFTSGASELSQGEVGSRKNLRLACCQLVALRRQVRLLPVELGLRTPQRSLLRRHCLLHGSQHHTLIECMQGYNIAT